MADDAAGGLPEFSDYVVYVDESGDHSLSSINPDFPMFALTFCVVKKTDYLDTVVPAAQRFKFDFWGHDSVVLHEIDIRKRRGPFAFLLASEEVRSQFLTQLSNLIAAAPIEIFASVIDKRRLMAKYDWPRSPYEIALLFCMERLFDALISRNQEGRLVHVVFESRGKNEDRELELEFQRICDNRRNWGYRNPNFHRMRFEPVFVKKSANSTGLQLADLTARPIALNLLRPEQPNRAYDLIAPKVTARKNFP